MNTLSIPAVFMAGVSFYVGFYHLLLYLRRKQHREDLSFAVLCLAAGFYDAFCAGLYSVHTVADGVKWQRAQFMVLALCVTAFMWFVSDYTHQNKGFVLYALSAFFLLAFILQAFDRSSLTWIIDQPFVKEVSLPFGIKATYYEATLGLFTSVQSWMGLAAGAFILWSGIQYYRQGYKRETAPLLVALALLFAAGVNDTAVTNGIYAFVYTIEYGFMAIILSMAYLLSTMVVDSATAKEAIRESEERFRTLVETTSDWVWEVDLKGVYTYVSPKVHDLLGYAPKEIIGRTPFDLMPADEAERIAKIFNKALKKKTSFEAIENINCHKDGHSVVLETSGVPFFDSNGNLQGYRGIDRDITNRKQSELDLQQKTEEFNRFFDVVVDLLCIADTDGYFRRLNPVWEKTLGYTREELMSKKFFEFIHPDDLDDTLKAISRLESQGEVVDFFNRYRCSDGTYRWLEWRSVPFGKLIYAAARDITESRKAEEALRESQQMLLSVLDTIPVRVFWKDRDLKFLGCNLPFALDAGLNSVEQIIGKDDWEMGWAEQAESYRTDDRDVIQTGQPKLNYEEQQTTPDGRRVWLLTSKVPLRDAASQVKGILGTYEDITDRKRSEEAIQRQLKELTILRAISEAGAEAFSVDPLIEQITQIVGETLYVDNFGVLLLDEAKQSLRPHPSYHGAYIETLDSVHISQGIIGHVVTSGSPYYAADVRKDSYYLKSAPKTLSELCVPIKIGEKVIGVINAESSALGYFSENDERLLVTIADTLATAIEKIHLLEAERTRRREAETLRQAVEAISSSLELRQVLDTILISLKQVVPYDSSSVILVEGDHLRVMAVQGFAQPDQLVNQIFPLEDELFMEAQRTKKPIILMDANADPRFQKLGGTDYVRGWLGIPLILREAVIGFLTLDSRQPATYDGETASLALTFSQQAAVAIENARLYEQAVQATERWAILHRASQEIARASQDPEGVYEAVHQAAGKLMAAEAFAITMTDEFRNEIVPVYLVDKVGRWTIENIPFGRGLSGRVAKTGQSIIISDINRSKDEDVIHFGDQEHVRSILAVPLRLGETIIGMLSTQSYQPNAYTPEDQVFLEMLAAHAAVAIDNARLYGETLHRLNELEAVSRISTALRSAHLVEDMLPILLDETLQVLGSDTGEIILYDLATGKLKPAAARGWFNAVGLEPFPAREGIVGTVFSTGEVILIDEFATDPRTFDEKRDRIPHGWGGVCLPIRTMEDTIGVLCISVQAPRRMRLDEVHLLSTISEIAGNAIRRAVLHEQTERQVQRLASLRAIDTAISTILELRVTLSVLLDHIMTQLKVDAVDVLLLNANTQVLEHAASVGFRTGVIKHMNLFMGEGLAGQAICSLGLVYIPNLKMTPQDVHRQQLTGEDFVTYLGIPLVAKGQIKGVLEVYSRSLMEPDADWRSFFETLAGQTAIAIENALLFEELQRTNLDLSLAYDATIEGWSKALDMRDKETEGHTVRVTQKTLQLARMMGVSDAALVQIRRGALLHDIGKMGIPDRILYKTGKLTDEEWEIMHCHPTFAFDMLSPISYLSQALDIPYCHHENWNGSGYPRGLKGEQIPLAARIFAVVDVWDALTSDRPYRKAWKREEVIKYIRENRARFFDPKVVDNFLQMIAAEDTVLNPLA